MSFNPLLTALFNITDEFDYFPASDLIMGSHQRVKAGTSVMIIGLIEFLH